MPDRILVVDDDAAGCEALAALLGPRGFELSFASTGADALRLLAQREPAVLLTDINMPGMSGLELCRRVHEGWPGLPIVLVTAFGSIETAVGAIRAGAYDFISKPINVQELVHTLTRAMEHRRLKDENVRLQETVARQRPPAHMIGDSAAIREVYALLAQLGGADSSVLITGESGTGKELVAAAIHAQGARAHRPCVALNCAALPETMIESELFGHARGAFTDAKAHRKGLFLQAEGGTLFLDEIGEMPLGAQAKLLRALETRTLRPLGSDRDVPFDARIIAATSRDLETEVAEQRFREDLYYRINVIRVQVPPLRARGTDVVLLAEHFVAAFAAQFKKPVSGITPQAAEKLLSYTWPGNVRELRNCIERAVVLTRGARLDASDLPAKICQFERGTFVLPVEDPRELLPMQEVERRYVLQVLDAVHGSRTEASAALGFDRRTLYRKLKSYGVT